MCVQLNMHSILVCFKHNVCKIFHVFIAVVLHKVTDAFNFFSGKILPFCVLSQTKRKFKLLDIFFCESAENDYFFI